MIERRPGSRKSSVAWPSEWGTPPRDSKARREWIIANIRRGELRRLRGESVDWLAEKR